MESVPLPLSSLCFAFSLAHSLLSHKGTLILILLYPSHPTNCWLQVQAVLKCVRRGQALLYLLKSFKKKFFRLIHLLFYVYQCFAPMCLCALCLQRSKETSDDLELSYKWL